MKKTWSASNISTLLVIAAIVVVVNLIGMRLFARADLTDQSIYTLSQASRNVVGNLEDRLTVKAFFTKDMPASLMIGGASVSCKANSRFILDLLEDYRAYGGGDFHYEVVDPLDDEQLEKEAQMYRLQPVQGNVLERDELKVKIVYMGLVLIYGTKHETIPVILQVNNLEYELTSTIKRLTAEKLPKIAFLSDFGTAADQATEVITRELRKQYEVTKISTKQGSSLIPDDIETLCIIQPKEPLDEWSKFVIDQFIMRGGKVAWFVNKVEADAGTSQATALSLDMDEWTRRYGFVVSNNLVLDASAAMVMMQRQQGQFIMASQIAYPGFPEVRDFNQDHPITDGMNAGTLFFPSSIDTAKPADGNVAIVPLLQSTEYTIVQTGQFDINPDTRRERSQFTGGKKIFAAALTGSFPSFFKGKGVPTPSDSTAITPALNILTESSDTRMVVVGDGNLLQGQYIQQGGPNLVLFLNTIDWLSQDTDLLAIRSRDAAVRPLDANISDDTKQRVKLANLIGPPALVLLIGVIRWNRRRKRKEVSL